jgi:hypothetical protein
MREAADDHDNSAPFGGCVVDVCAMAGVERIRGTRSDKALE